MPDVMPDRLARPPLPTLRGQSVLLRRRRESDIDDRVREPIDPEEEDAYSSSWRREWDGRRYHARADVAGRFLADERTLTPGLSSTKAVASAGQACG